MFRKLPMIFIVLTSFLLTSAFAQETVLKQSTWQQQLESVKNRNLSNKTKATENPDEVRLIAYKSIGTIDSEQEIPTWIDKVFAEESYIVHYVNEENFDIVPISTLRQSGHEHPFTKLKSQLEQRIQVDMDIIDLTWDYKGKIIHSTGIASNDQGGMIYDNIGHFILSP